MEIYVTTKGKNYVKTTKVLTNKTILPQHTSLAEHPSFYVLFLSFKIRNINQGNEQVLDF